VLNVKVVKNFDERPHHRERGGFFYECTVTPTNWEHCSWLQQSRCHAVIENLLMEVSWTLVICIHRSRGSQCMGWTTPELSLPVGGFRPPSNIWFPGPMWVNPKRLMIGSAVFAQLSRVKNTDTHNWATSVEIGHIYAMHAMWHTNNFSSLLYLLLCCSPSPCCFHLSPCNLHHSGKSLQMTEFKILTSCLHWCRILNDPVSQTVNKPKCVAVAT